nr:AAA family ATPase [Phytoactinopolyspora mesophila]
MIGRTDEMAQLRALWRATRANASQLVLLSGEAGVGKTRLAAEMAAEAASDGAIVLLGHCDQAAPIPYAPLTDAFHANTEVGDALAQAPARLQRVLAGLVRRPVESHDGGEQDPDEQHEGQAAIFAAVADLLRSVTTRAPTLFVIEDGEALDGSSARLLRHLVRHLPARLLLLLCFRDPPGSRHAPLRELLADTERTGVATRAMLSPLTERELAAVVGTWTGTSPSPDVVHALWSSTGGNPFYARAVVDDVMAKGDIDDATEFVWHVPTSVRDVLRDRLGRLSPVAQDVVASAAVLGGEVEVGLLAAVANRSGSEFDAALQETAGAGWLVESVRAWDVGYAFRHALMREAIHVDLPAPYRQRLHLRAAQALERAGFRRPADVAAAAVHLRSAGSLGDRERAAALSLQAADATARLYAWDEAVAHAEAAVSILDGIDAPPAVRADAAQRAAELLTTSTIDLSRAVRYFESALSLYQEVGDQAAVAAIRSRLGYVLSLHHSVMDVPTALENFAAAADVVTNGEAAFDVQYGTALASLFGLQTQSGLVASARAMEIARNLERRDLAARVRATEACHVFSAGGIAHAYTLIDEAWEVIRDVGDPWLAWDVATAGAMLASIFLLDPESSRTWCHRAFSQPRFDSLVLPRQGMTDQLVYALAIQGDLEAARQRAAVLPGDAVSRRHLLLIDGDWEAAEQSWSAALDHDLSHGDMLNAVFNAYWAGQARWLLGHPSAVDALSQALELCVPGPYLPAELMVRGEMTRYVAARGDVDDALTHLARCDEICAAGEDWRGRAGHVELARGAVAAAQGEHDRADAAYREALDVFSTFELPWWRAETLLGWARCLDGADRPADAYAKRRAARAIYDQLSAHNRWHHRQ